MGWWNYLLLVNTYLILFYVFYVLFLSRETFFQLNRLYLVAAALLSFLIPLIQANWVKKLFITQKVQYTIYSNPVMFYRFKPIEHSPFTIGQIVFTFYITGIIVLLARLAWQLFTLKREINKPANMPYSFFKKIRLGDNATNYGWIEAHENAHAHGWHSADILMIEAVMIVNWFNSIVYLYRFSIKHIHEYIADRKALGAGANKADYAMLLLSQTFNAPAHQLVNPFFNRSLLKQRIMMLQKNRSQRIALIKYGLSAPLFMLMLILTSATLNNSSTVRLIKENAELVLLTPAAGGNYDSNRHDKVIKKAANGLVIENTIKRVEPRKTLFLKFRTDTNKMLNEPVFTSVERVPTFPGGLEAFGHYLASNIRYPARSREKGIQGRVIISFIVEKDGSLSGVKVARGVATDIDQEALRVIRTSPDWKPGTQNGKPVRVAYSVPISFTLSR